MDREKGVFDDSHEQEVFDAFSKITDDFEKSGPELEKTAEGVDRFFFTVGIVDNVVGQQHLSDDMIIRRKDLLIIIPSMIINPSSCSIERFILLNKI